MTRHDLQQYLKAANVRAFLKMIRLGEGTSDELGYQRIFGGTLFKDFKDHPRKFIPFTSNGKQLKSSAAGAYQFLARTWDGLVKQYGFPDFSPACQDEAAVALIVGRNAIDDVLQGRIEIAINKCNKEWASLPNAPYGQPTVSMKRAIAEYLANGGYMQTSSSNPIITNPLKPEPKFEGPTMLASNDIGAIVSDVATPPFVPTSEEKEMLPFVAAAIPALISAAPDLIRIFGDSPTSERNAKAAEKVVEIAKAVTGASNSEEAVNRIDTDPAMAAAFREQARKDFLEIEAAADKRIEAAREFNKTDPALFNGKHWFSNIKFIHLLSTVMIIGSYIGGWTVLRGNFSGDLKAAVVTLMLVGGFTSVAGFWLGSSSGSERKNELLERR